MEYEKPTTHEELQRFRLQELFDKRYVLLTGEYRLVKLLVFGCAGLLLTAVVVALSAVVVHSGVK